MLKTAGLPMPGKMARSAARQPFGLPKVTAAARAVSSSAKTREKRKNLRQFGSRLENPGLCFNQQQGENSEKICFFALRV